MCPHVGVPNSCMVCTMSSELSVTVCMLLSFCVLKPNWCNSRPVVGDLFGLLGIVDLLGMVNLLGMVVVTSLAFL